MCVSASKGRVAASADLHVLTASSLSAPLCRAALMRGASPDLAAAPDGVTHAKLFPAGEQVADQTIQGLLDMLAFSNFERGAACWAGAGAGPRGGRRPRSQALALAPWPDPPA
jgi:hypothetical protein